MIANEPPKALFDSLEYLRIQSTPLASDFPGYALKDIDKAKAFLLAYDGSQGTFNAYRRELERLIHWCARIAKKSFSALKSEDIEAFVLFSQDPPTHWIGKSKPPKFIVLEGRRVPNPAWRPFIIAPSKVERRHGIQTQDKSFELSSGSVREVFAILSSFFNYLLGDHYVMLNPVALIRQKSKFIQKQQGSPKIRRLTELQWQYVIETAKQLADANPTQHERTLFMMSALYGMYLRISELASSERWQACMNDFERDADGNWWFTTLGKGNKTRQIAVSDAMLDALKRWRLHLGLSALPSPADSSVLLPKLKGRGPIKSTNAIRDIVQHCFDRSYERLVQDGLQEEAETLNEATVHWLRHTGISDDVKIRPREHVRDDAGHSSGAITDRYIDIHLRERHLSAKKKLISDLE